MENPNMSDEASTSRDPTESFWSFEAFKQPGFGLDHEPIQL